MNKDRYQNRKKRALKKSPHAPKRFNSSYIFFIKEKLFHYTSIINKQKANGSGEICNVRNVLLHKCKEFANIWQSLSESDKAPYENAANLDKLRYYEEMHQYDGPQQVPNIRKKKPLDAPKRAISAFLSYYQMHYAQLRMSYPTETNKVIMKILSKQWQQADQDTKQIHIDRERKERERYHQEMVIWKENNERSINHLLTIADGSDTVTVITTTDERQREVDEDNIDSMLQPQIREYACDDIVRNLYSSRNSCNGSRDEVINDDIDIDSILEANLAMIESNALQLAQNTANLQNTNCNVENDNNNNVDMPSLTTNTSTYYHHPSNDCSSSSSDAYYLANNNTVVPLNSTYHHSYGDNSLLISNNNYSDSNAVSINNVCYPYSDNNAVPLIDNYAVPLIDNNAVPLSDNFDWVNFEDCLSSSNHNNIIYNSFNTNDANSNNTKIYDNDSDSDLILHALSSPNTNYNNINNDIYNNGTIGFSDYIHNNLADFVTYMDNIRNDL